MDSILIDAVFNILAAVGIPINLLTDLINSIVDDLLLPIDFPTISVMMPDLDDYFNVRLDLDALLIEPIQAKLGGLLDGLTSYDLLGDAYTTTETGIDDMEVEDFGGVEFLYASGTAESITVGCQTAGEFPYAFSAIASNRCGSSDFTNSAELPCGISQQCDFDIAQFGDLPFCPTPVDESSIFDFPLDIVSGSKMIYVCITGEQFANRDGLALLRDTEIADIDELLGKEFEFVRPNVVPDNSIMTLDLFPLIQETFEIESIMPCPDASFVPLFAGLKWKHSVEDPGTCIEGGCQPRQVYGIGVEIESKYFCLVPGRGVPLEDDTSGIKKDHHIAFHSITGFLDSPTFSTRMQYLCSEYDEDCTGGGCGFCMDFFNFDRSPDIQGMELSCEDENKVIQIVEVFSQYSAEKIVPPARVTHTNHYATVAVEGELTDETDKFITFCAGKQNCSFQGDADLVDEVCADDTSECNPFVTNRLGNHYRIYRADYRCIDTCSTGEILLPDPRSGVCYPCGEGKYRDDSMDTCTLCPSGTFSDVEKAVACELCPIGTYSDALGTNDHQNLGS